MSGQHKTYGVADPEQETKARAPQSPPYTMETPGTAVITGGAGFIGSHLVERLAGECRLRIIDDCSTGSRDRIAQWLDREDVTFIKEDINDLGPGAAVWEGVDTVFHQAALRSVGRSLDDPFASDRANSRGTLSVLEASRKADIDTIVAASSSSVYGDSEQLPKEESMPTQPRSPYAASKMAGENYCRSYSEVYGINTACLRYFNVYGPRQPALGEYTAVIPNFIAWIRDGTPPVIEGDGEQTRDFTYVGDVVDANLQAAAASADGVFNIATGQQTSIQELAEVLIDIMDADVLPEHTDPRPGDVQHARADISQAQETFGYEPVYELRSGLEETVPWYL